MFRILFLTLMILIFVSDASAGLDNADLVITGLAIYDFESVEENEIGEYIENRSLEFNLLGYLYEGAGTANHGDFGESLRLTKDAYLQAGTRIFPNSFHAGFSIVAWVKLQQQRDPFVFSMTAGKDDVITGGISLFIEPDGNLLGVQSETTEDIDVAVRSTGENVANNEWHHIAYTKYYHTYSLYIDGELVSRIRSTDRPQLHGDVFLLWITSVGSLVNTVYVDEVGFFQDNFSTYEIKGLYKDGFKTFLETMPVSPQGRLTTTWGELKSEHQ